MSVKCINLAALIFTPNCVCLSLFSFASPTCYLYLCSWSGEVLFFLRLLFSSSSFCTSSLIHSFFGLRLHFPRVWSADLIRCFFVGRPERFCSFIGLSTLNLLQVILKTLCCFSCGTRFNFWVLQLQEINFFVFVF